MYLDQSYNANAPLEGNYWSHPFRSFRHPTQHGRQRVKNIFCDIAFNIWQSHNSALARCGIRVNSGLSRYRPIIAVHAELYSLLIHKTDERVEFELQRRIMASNIRRMNFRALNEIDYRIVSRRPFVKMNTASCDTMPPVHVINDRLLWSPLPPHSCRLHARTDAGG